MTTLLGIDPGLAATGIAVVEGSGMSVTGYSYGTIRTDAKDPVACRLNRIFNELIKILDQVSPDAVMVEDVFSLPRYPKSGITLGQVTGVILLAGYRNAAPVLEIAVREVKQVLTGNGNAGKKQLEANVRQRLGHPEPIKPSHASDALALALVGLYRAGSPAGKQVWIGADDSIS
ncbi:MAG: crossover junction endodeoxyribonuclease RuvC [Desulfobacteraceae bacterium]|nr:crossover junction endodeoxyribonuclease RuvC [Desulfobacteraceae bacterium]MCF8096037.1 crossover junction endodeoxyribonuclease RuvC [Desulfobacteraceae bacterium]